MVNLSIMNAYADARRQTRKRTHHVFAIWRNSSALLSHDACNPRKALSVDACNPRKALESVSRYFTTIVVSTAVTCLAT